MVDLPRNTDLEGLSQLIVGVVLDAHKCGFSGKNTTPVRDLQNYLNADLCGLYLLDEHLRPNATLVSHPARGFLKGYEDFRNRDPILLHLLMRRHAIDGVSLLGFEGWVRHPLARFMKCWNLQYSLQGAIWNEDRMIATLNFAREEKYGPFASTDVGNLDSLCKLISARLLLERGTDSSCNAPRSAIRFSKAGNGQGINYIFSDSAGVVLDTDIVPASIHPCLAIEDLERSIAFAIKILRTQGLPSVEREILENQTAIAKLCTFGVAGSSNFMTVVMRLAPADSVQNNPLNGLGTRQHSVLDLVVRGYSNKLIARELGISENTVKDHLRRLFSHFGVSGRAELTWILHGQV